MGHDTEQFEVVIVGFEPAAESPVQRLTRGFGIEPALAQQLVAQLPQAVQRGVPRVRAEYFRRALELLGARVEVVDAEGRRVERSEPGAADAGDAAGADAMLDVSAASARVEAGGEALSPRAIAGLGPDRFEVRSPAAPTLREGDFAEVAAPPPVRTPLDVAAVPPAAARAQRDAAAVPPASAFGTPDPLVPRVPSSVFDPPPGAVRPASRALVPASPAVPRAPASVRPAPRSGSPRDDAARFDLSKSVVGNGLWRSPSNRPPAAAEALTLDPVPQNAELRVLSSWEQPNLESMAEPKPRSQPVARSEPKNLQLPNRQLFSVQAPKVAPNEGAFAVVSRALSSGPPGARAGAVSSPARPPSGQPGASRSDPAAATSAPSSGRPRVPAPSSGRAPAGSNPAPKSGPAPVAAGVYPHQSDQPRVVLDTRGFFEAFGDALSLPFRGAGVYWLAAIAVWSVAVGLFGVLNHYALYAGGAAMFCAQTSVLALACDYYRLCMWAPLTGEDELESGPNFDAGVILGRYIRAGLNLSFFCIVSQLPLILYLLRWAEFGSLGKLFADPRMWLFALLPYFYWPMGVAIASVNNNFAAIWNVAAGFRAIARAPLEYLVIVLAGVVALVGSWTLLVLFGSMFGVTLALIGGTSGLPIAISHGVQGALMGHLARAKSEVFE